MTRISVEVKKGFQKHQKGVSEKSSRLDGKASRLDEGVDWFPEEQLRQSTG